MDAPDAIPVPDDDDDDMSNEPQLQLANPHQISDLGIPSKEEEMDDPDANLERLLAKRKINEEDGAPPWATTLVSSQQHMCGQLSELSKNLGSLQSRLQIIEDADIPRRMQDMEQQIMELKGIITSMSGSGFQVPTHSHNQPFSSAQGSGGVPNLADAIPHHREHGFNVNKPVNEALGPDQGSAGNAYAAADTDFNHLVLGGWPEDTRRKIVESDTWEICRRFESVKVERVTVYGSRAHISHVYLPALDVQEARIRFYDLQEKHSKKVQSRVGGEPLWISPSRTAARRAKNRATRDALMKLQKLLGTTDPEIIETDWTRQIIWYKDMRVAAGTNVAVRAKEDARVVSVSSGSGDDTCHYYYNITALAQTSGTDTGAVETALHSS